jgi:hypothetical protein
MLTGPKVEEEEQEEEEEEEEEAPKKQIFLLYPSRIANPVGL